MNEVFQCFDRFFLARKKYPELIMEIECAEKLLKLAKDGFLMPLKKRTSEGQKIILQDLNNVDMSFYTPSELKKTVSFYGFLAVQEEENQIAGMIVIVNSNAAALKKIPADSIAFTALSFWKYAKCFKFPQVYYINLPPFVKSTLDIVLSLAGEKIKKRVVFLTEKNELKNYVDPELLPKSFGGNCELEDIVEDFDALYKKRKKIIEEILATEIDWSKVSEKDMTDYVEGEYVGSFRKLEVD
jgi:hypothetical protein